MIDASRQVHGRLPIQYGGTGNAHGNARGAVVPCAYFPGDYSVGGSGSLAHGALVKLNGSWPTVTQTTDPSDRAMGVCIGSFNVNSGEITTGVAVAAGDTAAILIAGVADVVFDAAASAGQFVSPAATDGRAVAGSGFRLNAVGQVMEAVSGAGALGKVLVVNVLGSLSAGSASDVHASFFGALSVAGSVGLMADAGHVHQREPDASGIPPGATASATSSNGSHTPDKAIDSNPTTYWESSGPIIAAKLTIDLGFARQVLRSVLTQGGNGGNSFSGYTIESSNDGSSWTLRETRMGQGVGIADTWEPSAVTTARYWRFSPTAGVGNAQIQSVDLRVPPYPVLGADGLIPAEYVVAATLVPTYIAPAETFHVPADRQALFVMPIENEGLIDLDGYLIGVD